MPEKETLERAEEDKREGKSASTQAGEFVREEMHHIREGKHGAANTKQAIAIGLSKARRAGVKMGTPKNASASTRKKAKQDTKAAQRSGGSKQHQKTSRSRSQATSKALKKEPHSAASKKNLSKHAKSAAKKRSASSRHEAAMKAARTRKRAA